MFLAVPESSDATERIYKSSADSQGFVMNLTRAWAWRPDVYEAFAALRAKLTSKSNLTKRDQAVIVCATAAQLGDSYCSLAWGKTLAAEAGPASAAAVLAARESHELTGATEHSPPGRERWSMTQMERPSLTSHHFVQLALRTLRSSRSPRSSRSGSRSPASMTPSVLRLTGSWLVRFPTK